MSTPEEHKNERLFMILTTIVLLALILACTVGYIWEKKG